MQPGSAFNNNNNQTKAASSSPWGNPNVGNNPFTMPSKGAFSAWSNSPTKNTNTNGFKSAFSNNDNNNKSSEGSAWWSNSTTNKNNDTTDTNQSSSAFSNNTSSPFKMNSSAFSQPQFGNNGNSNGNGNGNGNHSNFNNNHSASFNHGNGQKSQNDHFKNNKPKRLQPSEESRVFIGNWKQKMSVFHITLKHRQNDSNCLIVLASKSPVYELKVTAFGIVKRTDLSSGQILNGIVHINHQRKGCLSILWHDDNGNQQHYWNQNECHKYKTNQCQFGINCRFAHIDATLINKLKANNEKVSELQKQRQTKLQNKSHIVHSKKAPFGNKVTTFNNNNNSEQTQSQSQSGPKFGNKVTTFNTKSGITFQAKTDIQNSTNNNSQKQKMSAFDRNISAAFNNSQNNKKSHSNSPKKVIAPKQLKSYKNGPNEEGISFTTTYFDANGQSKGTFISTQDQKSSNSISVPQQPPKPKPPQPMQNQAPLPPNLSKQPFCRSLSSSNDSSYEMGQCYLMCPIDESLMRLNSKQFKKKFEANSFGNYDKYSLIKEYSKSNAGQKKRLKDVRCGSVLRLTMQYLMNITLHLTHIPFCHRFSFLEDRIRSIVKDVYVQHLVINDKETSIELLETSIRFRIFSHLLICHMDEHINQQKIQFPASTKFESAFLNQNLNEKNEKFSYSSAQNLAHLSNIFSKLFSLYKARNFDNLSAEMREDEVEIYCLCAYHSLVEGALKFNGCKGSNYQNCAKKVLCDLSVPTYIRKHKRIKIAKKMIDAYANMNNVTFFKLFNQRLSICEQAMLYPILDHFRLICIRKMCQRKILRMKPRNTFNFSHFNDMFGFYRDHGECVDVTDFLSWFGGFDANEIGRIINSGLTMDDFARIKSLKDLQRFAARDGFLGKMEEVGLQKVFQSSSYVQIKEDDFLRVFGQIETAKDVGFVDAQIDELFTRCRASTSDNAVKINNSWMSPRSSNNSTYDNSNHNNNGNNNWGSMHNSMSPNVIRPFATSNQQHKSPPLFSNQKELSQWTKSPPLFSRQMNQSSNSFPVFQPAQLDKKEPALPNSTAPKFESVDAIKSREDKTLQPMVLKKEWKKVLTHLMIIKQSHKEHPEWTNILKPWYRSYKEEFNKDLNEDLKHLNNANKDWLLFESFIKKWKSTAPQKVKEAYSSIKAKWFKFKKNENVYIQNEQFTVSAIQINGSNPPILTLLNNQNGQIQTKQMFDSEIMSQSEYDIEMARKQKEETMKKLAREKAELERKIALRQQQEREQREREREQTLIRQKEEEKREILRQKLVEQQRKKEEYERAKELKRRQEESLNNCQCILEEITIKSFVSLWKKKANNLQQIRKHFRLKTNDKILQNNHYSMRESLDLLQRGSPQRNATISRIIPRKRSSSEYAESSRDDLSFVSLQSSAKRQKVDFESFVVPWNYKQIMNDLYAHNKESIDIMMINSNNLQNELSQSYVNPIDLMFNVLISSKSNLILQYFGCTNPKNKLEKKIFVDDDNKKLHFCVITDDKIKSIGATQKNCIRGFQSYVHQCDATAILDFDQYKNEWYLNGEHCDDFIVELSKNMDGIRDNLRLIHAQSHIAMIILIECQPLFTHLREDEVAMKTVITFNEKDKKTILSALNVSNLNSKCSEIMILGIPSWPNADCLYDDTFKFAMDWMISHSPKYPKIHKNKTNVICNLFEKIFDSPRNILSEMNKINLWNSEVANLSNKILCGVDANISWPPCSIDDKHELVTNYIVPPSIWNCKKQRMRISASIKGLRMNECQNDNYVNMKRKIIQKIAKLDGHWWSMTDITKIGKDLYAESSISDTSTFRTFVEEDAPSPSVCSSTKHSQQLLEFSKLVDDVSMDFENTLHGIQSCSTVLQSIQDRMEQFQ